MPLLELPHTRGCVVCDRDNPHGLRLSLRVNSETSIVTVEFTPQAANIGFDGIVHGGVLATILDEAMVWAAIWAGRRFCLCGELTTRFRRPAEIGRRTTVEAKVEFRNPRLIQTVATLQDDSKQLLATASGKYLPVSPDEHATFLATLIEELATTEAAGLLRSARTG
jgi:acyl-coenzyme A thioesterase PaaI-like protein